MKWFVILIAVVIGYFVGRELMTPSTGKNAGPRGVAVQFLNESRANNIAGAAALAEPDAQQAVTQTAQQIASLGIDPNWTPMWQRTSTDHAADAYSVQITGKSQMLVIEVNRAEGDQYKVHTAVLATM